MDPTLSTVIQELEQEDDSEVTDHELRKLRDWARRKDVREYSAFADARIALGEVDIVSDRYRRLMRKRCARHLRDFKHRMNDDQGVRVPRSRKEVGTDE